MIQSHACNLHKMNKELLTVRGECPYDKGGYFIVNGNEKVLVAQEKLINNKVYIFKKKERNNIKLVAQCKYICEFLDHLIIIFITKDIWYIFL